MQQRSGNLALQRPLHLPRATALSLQLTAAWAGTWRACSAVAGRQACTAATGAHLQLTAAAHGLAEQACRLLPRFLLQVCHLCPTAAGSARNCGVAGHPACQAELCSTARCTASCCQQAGSTSSWQPCSHRRPSPGHGHTAGGGHVKRRARGCEGLQQHLEAPQAGRVRLRGHRSRARVQSPDPAGRDSLPVAVVHKQHAVLCPRAARACVPAQLQAGAPGAARMACTAKSCCLGGSKQAKARCPAAAAVCRPGCSSRPACCAQAQSCHGHATQLPLQQQLRR